MESSIPLNMERRQSSQDFQTTVNATANLLSSQEVLGTWITRRILGTLSTRVVNLQISTQLTKLQAQLRALDQVAKSVKDFLLSPIGPMTNLKALYTDTENPYTVESLTNMNDALRGAHETLTEHIGYPDYLRDAKKVTTSYPVKGEDAIVGRILGRLEKDITCLTKIQEDIAAVLARFKGEWSILALEASAGLSNDEERAKYTNPITVITKAWEDRQFDMTPSYPSELDRQWLNPYEAEMEKRGLDWFSGFLKQNDRPSSQSKGFLRGYEAMLVQQFRTFSFPTSKAQLKELDLPELAISRWNELNGALTVLENPQPTSLRLCLFGATNSGKSTFINALLGYRLLDARQTQVTAWPIVIRHARREAPILIIEHQHFEPFLDFLRTEKFSGLRDEGDPRCEDAVYDDRIGVIRTLMDDTFNMLLEWEKDGSAFPETVENTSQKPTAIVETILKINTLVRLCWDLCAKTSELPSTSNVWPVVEAEFSAFSQDTPAFELLDTPGQGESGNNEHSTKVPLNLFESALSTCPDGSICAIMVGQVRTPPVKSSIKTARESTQSHPLALYGTWADIIGEADHQSSILDLNKAVYNTNPVTFKGPTDRTKLCQAGGYMCARNLFNLAGGQEVVERSEGKILRTLVWPEAKPDFDTLWEGNKEVAAVSEIFGAKNPMAAREEYNNMHYSMFKAKVFKAMSLCGFDEVVKHFESYVLQDGKDRRQLRQLVFVRICLERLLRATMELTAHLIERRDKFLGEQKAMRKEYTQFLKFHEVVLTQRETWMDEWAEHCKNISLTLEISYEDLRHSAQLATENAIRHALGELNLDIIGSVVSIDEPAESVAVLESIQAHLSQELDSLQQMHVENTRSNAFLAWTSLLESLALNTERVPHDSQLASYALREIVSRLHEACVDKGSMELAIYTHILCKISGETGHSVDKAQVDAVKNQICDSNLPNQVAAASASHREFQPPSDVTSSQITLVTELNRLGFLLRPYVTGTINCPHLVKVGAWDQAAMTGVEGGSTMVDFSSLTDTIVSLYVDPWMETIQAETETTMTGTLEMVSNFSTKVVVDFLTTRKHYASSGTRTPSTVDELIQRLVTTHARLTAFKGVVDGVCKESLQLIDPIILTVSKNKRRGQWEWRDLLGNMTDLKLHEKDRK